MASKMKKLKFIFRSLKHKNYKLFFGGQSVSLIGTWMQHIAMSWLVYRLTNSAFLLGMVGFLGQIPTFILTPFAGVLVDRYNKHRILMITQVLAMLQAFVLAILVLTDNILVWEIFALSMFLGLINAFDVPVRNAFTVEMIEKKEDLGNAIALNSTMVTWAKLVGPTLAGFFIASFGEGICFLINAVSYIAVIASLLAMNISRKKIKISHQHIFKELKDGFVYAFNFKPIKHILALLALVSLMGVPYQILLPIFAKDIFHGGPKTLGFLMAMAGIGASMGAMYLARRESIVGLYKIIAIASGAFGFGIILFGLSKFLWLSMAIMCFIGFSMMVHVAASNTILQTIVDENKRGRVMSFYTMAFMGMAPFGSLFAGSLAHKIGAPNTFLITGVCCIIGAVWYFKKR